MADYGNHFTSNSGNYNYNTRGHSYDDSGWVIVGLANSGNVSQPIPHPNGAEFTGNNTTCYFYTTNHMTKPNREVKTGNDYVAYFKWATDNKNTKGSIDGDFNFYPFGSKTDSRFVEPTGLDDTKHGVSPYSNSNNNVISRTNLSVKGTTFTAGYRRHKIHYEPSIRYDLASYNYGTNDNYKSDGSTKATGGRVVTQRYDAFQTFYNIKDPYSVLNISITNHDDAKSSSPIFCTLTNNKSEYRINYSYTYTPYKNSATWNNANYLSFTYNTLPTYPKELVFTYGSNYNSIPYDGGSITVEAKARYNGTYDRFTTSTANDDGFSSYKRYVDVTYSLSTFNSSTTPTGSNTYTFRIWQPGSKLGISYTWSIDGNPSWAHLSTTSGNTTKVTFDDQGDDKPSVGGTLSLSLNNTTISNGGSTTGSVSGVSWTAPTNKAARSCVLRQNMTVTNYCVQNITPKTSSGQPYQSLTLMQNGMTWNNPSFDMKWKVTQKSKTTTTYNDGYGHGWPTVNIGGVSTSDGTEKTTGWNYNTSSKSVSVTMPTISRPWINTYSGGKVTITKGSNTAVSYKGGSVTINLDPNITFRQGFTSGVSERTWTISNTANNATNQEYWSLNKFNDVFIKLPAIAAANYAFGDATLSWRDTGTQDLTFSKSSRTWNNSNSDDSFTATLAPNLPTIGNWYASASNGTLTFTSTTKNSGSTSGTITFSGSTYQDGVLTPSPSSITISQNGTSISGTISISGTGEGINSYDASVVYPIDGNTTTGSYKLKDPLIRYLTGPGSVRVTIFESSLKYSDSTISFDWYNIPSSQTVEERSQDYKITVTSDIVSTYPSNSPTTGVILSGSVLPTGPNYKYQFKVNSDGWVDFPNSPSTRVNGYPVGTNYAFLITNTSATLVKNSETDIRNGIYNYTPGVYVYTASTDKTHTVYVRVVDTNNSDLVFEGESDSITQGHEDSSTSINSGDFTISFAAVDNCTVSKKTESVSGTTSQSNCGKFSATISDSRYEYIGAYSKSDTRSYDRAEEANCSATKKGENKTFLTGTTSINETYGIESSTPDSITIKATGSKTWKVDYKYKVTANNDTEWHEQTSTYDGYESLGNYTANRYISFNGGAFTRLSTSGLKTQTATTLGTYSVTVRWGSSASDTSGKDITYTFVYDEHGKKIEYRISTCSISVGNISHTAFDSVGSTWSITATTSIKVEKRISLDDGATWAQDWAATSDYTSEVTYSGDFSGTGKTCSGTMSQGSSGSDGNTKTITFKLTVTASDGTKSSDTATSTWKWYGKSYYNA